MLENPILTDTYLKTDPDTNEQKILLVLALAHSPAPIGYISLHTEIKVPFDVLKRMEKRSLVRQCQISSWSCSIDPMYEITPEGLKNIKF